MNERNAKRPRSCQSLCALRRWTQLGLPVAEGDQWQDWKWQLGHQDCFQSLVTMNSDAKSYQIFEHWSILVAQWLFLSLCMKDHESLRCAKGEVVTGCLSPIWSIWFAVWRHWGDTLLGSYKKKKHNTQASTLLFKLGRFIKGRTLLGGKSSWNT